MTSSNGSEYYSQVIGGGLKFKLDKSSGSKMVQNGKIKKKKKPTSESSVSKKLVLQETRPNFSPVELITSNYTSSTSSKTKAELKFAEAQKKRQRDRISKLAEKSHKEKVDEFNKHLESLSEHYDIPKVGPG
ncbi:hypothetical protein HMI54_013452 [Coelomomyces lativittatus]|nr:hypothetical protein HMI54_013452 [Coelomomyces lativittatus]KAJ1500087.1 hypothetical protein HMI56_004042 [Coelomomyces lativittatus]KAJ1505996.1 hypothetical protein HMI55_001368 [Coelomomyces lativittatus]